MKIQKHVCFKSSAHLHIEWIPDHSFCWLSDRAVKTTNCRCLRRYDSQLARCAFRHSQMVLLIMLCRKRGQKSHKHAQKASAGLQIYFRLWLITHRTRRHRHRFTLSHLCRLAFRSFRHELQTSAVRILIFALDWQWPPNLQIHTYMHFSRYGQERASHLSFMASWSLDTLTFEPLTLSFGLELAQPIVQIKWYE